MALLSILEYPDTRLRTRAEPVTEFDQALSRLVDDMFETMYASKGIGLAATQVNIHHRVIVTDVSGEGAEPLLYINPMILSTEGVEKTEEGCLSVPGIYDEVARATRIRIRAQDRQGAFFESELKDLHAVCLQHEIDHLDGKLFVDYLSELKRQRIRRKLEKDRKDRLAERGSMPSGSARAY